MMVAFHEECASYAGRIEEHPMYAKYAKSFGGAQNTQNTQNEHAASGPEPTYTFVDE
jgi:hypothetical protein